MTVTASERAQIIEEYKAEERLKLSLRMSALGKRRSKKKLAAVRKNIKRAHAANPKNQ